MEKGITLRGRILQAILEVFIGVAIVFFLSIITINFLYNERIINSVNIKQDLNYEYFKTHEKFETYLKDIKLNYVLFDNTGRIEGEDISDSNLIIAKECFNKREDLKVSSAEYLFFGNSENSAVIRIPYVPEFCDVEMEERYPFNDFFNGTVLSLCFAVFLISVTRLFRQIRYEFLQLEMSILGDDDKRILMSPKIVEIQKSINQVNNLKRELFSLVEREKSQKNDLLFQTSALSHDIKTPLTIIKGNAGLLEYCTSREEWEECIKYINSGVETIEDYLDKMISYAKCSFYPEEKTLVKVNDLVSSILRNVKGYKKEIDFEIKYDGNEFETILCSRENVERAVVNIIINAYEHAKSKVIFTVICEDNLIFKIYNDGDLIGDKSFNNIGKLFFTEDKGRNNNRHYGIGLYFANNVASEHLGKLECKNLKDGVEFVLSIKK